MTFGGRNLQARVDVNDFGVALRIWHALSIHWNTRRNKGCGVLSRLRKALKNFSAVSLRSVPHCCGGARRCYPFRDPHRGTSDSENMLRQASSKTNLRLSGALFFSYCPWSTSPAQSQLYTSSTWHHLVSNTQGLQTNNQNMKEIHAIPASQRAQGCLWGPARSSRTGCHSVTS